MRIFVVSGSQKRQIECKPDENLLCALRRAGVSIVAACGGRGDCGKCRVKLDSFTSPGEAEQRLLTEKELAQKIRLACMTMPADGMCVEIVNSQKKIATVDYLGQKPKTASLRAVADLGTTTVTVAQVDENGNIVSAVSENNAQSTFGADVLARIEASEHDGGEQHRLIVSQLKRMAGSKVKELVVAGNTTMLHLLLGENCTGMGRYPFTPSFLAPQKKELDGMVFRTLPCLHSFVGADIAAGIIAAKPGDKFQLLVDLGTNAEIALFNREKVFATSAAAGPAFEGAKIRCGSAAVDGAICSFRLENGEKSVETIGGKPPLSLCGSGLLDAVAALLENGIIDETGAMTSEKCVLADPVFLCAEDVREFQLAKSAVRTGIEMLLERAGVGFEKIERVLLGGGFGTFLNADSAAATGLLPPEAAKKAVPAGNTSLLGAAAYAYGNTALPENAEVFNLAETGEFNDRFIDNLLFDC